MKSAEEQAKEIVKPFLRYGANKFDALLESAIESALTEAESRGAIEALEWAAEIVQPGGMALYEWQNAIAKTIRAEAQRIKEGTK